MPIETVEHTWIEDPDIAKAVKGESLVGGQRYLYVRNPAAESLLQQVLAELQKANLHLAALSNETITDHDIKG